MNAIVVGAILIVLVIFFGMIYAVLRDESIDKDCGIGK